jgi:hypothetical protein
MKPRHVKNIWENKPLKAIPILKTSPMTVTDIIFGDETCSTDHVGTTVVLTQIGEYYGDWDAVYIAANASGLGFPWYGDYAVGSDSYIFCSKTEVKWKGGNATSESVAAFDYVSTFTPITPERLDLSPLSRPALFEFGGSDLTEVRRYDASTPAKPIKNSAGDFFEGLPEFYVPGFEVSLIYNSSANPGSLISTYSFSTNSGSWNGQAAYSGAIGKINATLTFETYQGIQIPYWRVNVPIRFRTDGNGWTFQTYDYGYRYVNSGILTSYVDAVTGVYGPVFLNGSGGLLGGDGSARTATPVIYPPGTGGAPAGYQTLKPIDWSGASFPNPF